MRPGEPRCSSISERLEEPQLATASTVTDWILLEQPGPWGRDAVLENRMPRDVAKRLRRRARALGIRLVLIRRPGRSEPSGSHCYFAHTGGAVQRLEHAHLPGGPGDLLDVDWSPLPSGRPVGMGLEQPEPVFLVCTNGSRDPCCAERGRPVALALEAEYGDRVWECTHIGGDRFAANVVCFPEGIYLGRITPDDAVAVARRYEAGELDLERYRGRSSQDFATQAAEHFLRERMGLHGVRDVRLLERGPRPPAGAEAVFATPAGTVRVRVAYRPSAEPRRFTCHGPGGLRPPVFDLVDLALVPEPSGAGREGRFSRPRSPRPGSSP